MLLGFEGLVITISLLDSVDDDVDVDVVGAGALKASGVAEGCDEFACDDDVFASEESSVVVVVVVGVFLFPRTTWAWYLSAMRSCS